MNNGRYTFFKSVFAILLFVIAVRLYSLQITNGSYYRERSENRTRKVIELQAPRGEILDRYGRSIVKNRTGYSVYIQKSADSDSEKLNSTISNLLTAVKSYQRTDSMLSEETQMKELFKKYKLGNSFTQEKKTAIAAIRQDMEKRGFSMSSPYLFAEDVPLEEISVIKEQNSVFPDVTVIMQPVREYPYGSMGVHILGRVGKISDKDYKENKDNNYTINSYIGKDGIEKYMESFLRGENGSGSMEQTASGYGIKQNTEKEPVAGRSVTLTIDIDIQLAAEKALRETISSLRSIGANAGSVVVLDVNSSDILAMASYPSYNISTFSHDYLDLIENRAKPLFNRAIAGTYTPASTFKMLVATAALESGVIMPDERILDTGKYTYFDDYQPSCWIYRQSGATHGYENVSEAIRDSCNVFFYETGRRLTIEKIDEYASDFGFGKKTGIELTDEERSGVIAGPGDRESKGEIWYPGDTCQAAIGQSDTLVTPLQLANYIAALSNGGTRYKPHLIKSVMKTDGTIGNESRAEVVEKIKIHEENYNAVTEGMRMVVTEGTAREAFKDCSTPVAAKTGSAQTGSGTNGICVAYAPYDKPQIAIACVIEKGGSGAETANAVRKIVDSCFEALPEEQGRINTLLR